MTLSRTNRPNASHSSSLSIRSVIQSPPSWAKTTGPRLPGGQLGGKDHGGYQTRTEARKAAAALVAYSSRGRYVKPSELTVGSYLLQEWLPSRENADVSPNTRDTDRTVVDAWIVPHIGDRGRRMEASASRGSGVVTEPDGAIVHPNTLLGRWKRLVAAAGVPAIPLHGARHSYAMLALGAGARLDVESRQLGHSSAAFTADIYAHDSDEAAAAAAELLAEALDG